MVTLLEGVSSNVRGEHPTLPLGGVDKILEWTWLLRCTAMQAAATTLRIIAGKYHKNEALKVKYDIHNDENDNEHENLKKL